MIRVDDLHPKKIEMAKYVVREVFQEPMRQVLYEHTRRCGEHAPVLVLADEINLYWWFLAKRGISDSDHARGVAVAEQWLKSGKYGCDAPGTAEDAFSV